MVSRGVVWKTWKILFGSYMKLFATAPTLTQLTVPVAVTSIVTKVNAATVPSITTKVDVQPSSIAPDSSNKVMNQFGALVGNTPYAYPTTYQAQKAVHEIAAANGCTSFIKVQSDMSAVRILAW